ncbi:MAG: hypothetical protein ACR2OR_03590 [Hyphomicrobiales bacterium]
MLGKILITLVAVAVAGFAMKRFSGKPRSQPVERKPPPGSDGKIATLRKDPKTGEYVPEDEELTEK